MPYTQLVIQLGNALYGSNPSSLSNVTTFTYSQTNTSIVEAKHRMEEVGHNGGLFDDNNVWIPQNAILKITAQ